MNQGERRIIWDSHFGYEFGYYLKDEGTHYDTCLIILTTGVVQDITSKPFHEIIPYSEENAYQMKLKYGFNYHNDYVHKSIRDIIVMGAGGHGKSVLVNKTHSIGISTTIDGLRQKLEEEVMLITDTHKMLHNEFIKPYSDKKESSKKRKGYKNNRTTFF